MLNIPDSVLVGLEVRILSGKGTSVRQKEDTEISAYLANETEMEPVNFTDEQVIEAGVIGKYLTGNVDTRTEQAISQVLEGM